MRVGGAAGLRHRRSRTPARGHLAATRSESAICVAETSAGVHGTRAEIMAPILVVAWSGVERAGSDFATPTITGNDLEEGPLRPATRRLASAERLRFGEPQPDGKLAMTPVGLTAGLSGGARRKGSRHAPPLDPAGSLPPVPAPRGDGLVS